VLPTTAVSRYHAQIDVADGRVYLVDLGAVNGTFINDEQMEPNSRAALQSGDEITMGDVKLVYHSPETREYMSLTPSVEPVEKEDVPFKLLLDEPHQDVAPGARLNLVMILENTGPEDASYVIEVGGMEENWVRANWRELTLSPTQQAEVQISVRPPRSPTTLPGTYALFVRVALKDDPLTVLEATRRIDIVGYNGIAMNVHNQDRNGQYEVVIQNQGNQRANVQFGGFSRDGELDYAFSPRKVALDPGEVQRASLRVKPKSPVGLSKAEKVDFAVVARSLDAAAYQAPIPASYTLTTSPVTIAAGIGIPLVLGAVGVLAVLITLLFVFDVLPPGSAAPDPTLAPSGLELTAEPTDDDPIVSPPEAVATIETFSTAPAEVIYRAVGTVRLEWEVTNAESVTLYEGDDLIPLSEEEIEAGEVIIRSENLGAGDHEFRLNVVGEDGLPVNRFAQVTAQVQICRLAEGTVVYDMPSTTSEALAPPARPSVWVIGRSDDGEWIRIQYDEDSPQGWVQADSLTCAEEAVPLDDFFVVGAPATPTPESNEGG
jgi:hypothetical protein